MSAFYLDSSAVVKRYVPENGTAWIADITNPVRRHTIMTAEITTAEVTAAIAAKHRAPKGITRQERDDAVNIFLQHCNTEYQLVHLNRIILARATHLTQNHRLRGYDAVQLATAFVINNVLTTSGFSDFTFVSADNDLILAAKSEGLSTDNPNLYL
ncbi:MAG: type II toxin-antitoxin system VapC family toxin [Pseudomonadota bacterium]